MKKQKMTGWVKMDCIFSLVVFNSGVINETELFSFNRTQGNDIMLITHVLQYYHSFKSFYWDKSNGKVIESLIIINVGEEE